jgi:hypothetical protein
MKLKIGLTLFILLIISTANLYAQGGPVPCDPDDGCPLDTWTYVLVFAALVFVSFRLYRRQKTRSI